MAAYSMSGQSIQTSMQNIESVPQKMSKLWHNLVGGGRDWRSTFSSILENYSKL